MPKVEISENGRSLAQKAARYFVNLARETILREGRFTVAISGGSTPKQTYDLLALAPYRNNLDWFRIHFFWVDERCVPPDHSESNYKVAFESLLSLVPIPSENIHRIPGELPVQKAAQAYEKDLQKFFGDTTPEFCLILLGLGGDGHTASLFPGNQVTLEKDNWALSVTHTTPPAPLIDRVSLSLAVINAAKNVTFLVSGAEKAKVLAQVLKGPYQPDLLPAQMVKPNGGQLLWLVDQPAAEFIKS